MKATELKIGDLVSFRGMPSKVHSIDPPAVYVVDSDDAVWITGESSNDITPIPLTPEILKKNGWEREYKYIDEKEFWYDYISRLYLGRRIKNKFLSFNLYHGNNDHCVKTNIKYVHELQHLLWALDINDDLKI